MKALVLGICGQDGSYLADILLSRGYEVHGFYRRSSVDNLWRIQHVIDRVTLHRGDILDDTSLQEVICTVQPDELYNEADQDHVGWSYHSPRYSMDITAGAVASLLEICRQKLPSVRIFQPVSATMFGDAVPLQNEFTAFNPQSPYACAKAAAYHLANYYRQAFGMYITTGILYNHDSPRRSGDNYLLHDIAKDAVAVQQGKKDKILVGNLDMVVDIGFAKEYMEAVVQLMQLPISDNYIIGSGQAHTIKYLTEIALNMMGADISRIGINPTFSRPGKQPTLIGDITKLKYATGYSPQIGVEELIEMLLCKYAGEK